jgi:Glycosyl hydrolases family 43
MTVQDETPTRVSRLFNSPRSRGAAHNGPMRISSALPWSVRVVVWGALATALGCSSGGTPSATGTGGTTGSGGASSTGRGGDGHVTGGATGAGGATHEGGSGGGATSGGAGSSATGGATGGNGGAAGNEGVAGDAGGAAGGRGGAGGGASGGVGGHAATGGGAGHGSGGQAGRGAVDAGSTDAPSLAGTNNPVLPGLNADPQIALFDGVYYIYPTTDGFANWTATTFSVYSSTNLVDWTNRGVILDLPRDLTWATGHAWAPAITRVGGTYYFYFCADQKIGVATASSPTGPFKDALGHPLIATNAYSTQSIDPYLFTDDDGTHYLYFGSGTNGARVVKLGADMTSLVGTPANITPSGASGVVEGTVMFKRNGTYYLQWSEGDTRNATYRVAYAKAQAPTGPFARLGVILSQNPALGILGPGGNTVLAIPGRDEYYIVYHRFKSPGGDGTHRETCIDRMSFNGDGTIVPVTPTLNGLQTAVVP